MDTNLRVTKEAEQPQTSNEDGGFPPNSTDLEQVSELLLTQTCRETVHVEEGTTTEDSAMESEDCADPSLIEVEQLRKGGSIAEAS